METLFSVVVSNLLVAGLLAVVAWLVGRSGRRPVLAHALWVLVLVKLVTPPLVRISLPLPGVSAASVPAEPTLRRSFDVENETLPPEVDAEHVLALDRFVFLDPVAEEPEVAEAAPPLTPWWPTLLLGAWTLGSVGYLALAGWRAWWFTRRLREAEAPSRDLVRRVEALTARLGVTLPPVRVVHGRLSPLVWGIFRPCLVLPHGLEEAVGPAGWRTLVAHELAHLRRRDGLVRGLELLVGVLYWWCPLVWVACRELREAEEQCCDAWVVGSLPDEKKTYATALIDVLDFLSPAAVPEPLGCGLSPVADLKRRLTMILSGTTSPRLGRSAGLGLALLAAVVLPLVPGLSSAQAPPEGKLVDKVFLFGKPGEGQAQGQGQSFTLELKLADEQAELAALKAKMAEIEAMRAKVAAQMAEFAAKAKKAADSKPVEKPKPVFEIGTAPVKGMKVIRIELSADAKPEEAEALLKKIREVVGKDKKVTIQAMTPDSTFRYPFLKYGDAKLQGAEGVYRVLPTLPGTPTPPKPPLPPIAVKPVPTEGKRIEQLEQRLEKMLDQLEQLRKELKSSKK
jgi:beta-lactamase regulating signal transducer with metallopeptidase domain